MIPTPSCVYHKNIALTLENNNYICNKCKKKYMIHNNVPSILKKNPESESWNTWGIDEVKMSGDSYYKRSIGLLPEKEASKSFARFLIREKLYQKGDTVLDFGCATGHFLRSLRNHLDPEVNYTGFDSHFEFLQWGKKAYGDTCNFIHCDALDIPFPDKSFDISIVNLFHFFPDIEAALKEAIRVTKKYLVWRTPVGDNANYLIKIIKDDPYDKLGNLTYDRNDLKFDLYMLFAKKYIIKLIESLDAKVIKVEKDTDFEPFDNTVLPEFKYIPSTKTVGEYQINGSIVLDWHYFVIDCR